MENLPQDFKEFLNLFNLHEVDCLLVADTPSRFTGTHARSVILIFGWRSRMKTLRRSLPPKKAFGFDLRELTKILFLGENGMTRLGREPVKIEILNGVSGIDFASAKRRSIQVEFGGVVIPVICLADLRKNKAPSGRAKDLADLENLPLS